MNEDNRTADQMREALRELTGSVAGLDERAMDAAKKRQAELAKPPGSLGRLESLAVQLAGITGKVYNRIDKKTLLVFCADNGVVREGVASSWLKKVVLSSVMVLLANEKSGSSR